MSHRPMHRIKMACDGALPCEAYTVDTEQTVKAYAVFLSWQGERKVTPAEITVTNMKMRRPLLPAEETDNE